MYQRDLSEVNDLKLLPGFIKDAMERQSFEALSELIPAEVMKKARRVVLTGNGDSYCASLATRLFFNKMFNTPDIFAERCVDVGRHFYFGDEDLSETLVFVTSSSGTGARVTEAIERATKKGCTTFAVTTNPESNIGKAATYVLHEKGDKVWEYRFSGQSFTYANAMLNLYLVALYAGVCRGTITREQESELRAELVRYLESVIPMLDAIDTQMYELALKWENTVGYDFVGSGYDLAAGYFGAAKGFEYLGCYNQYTDSEDWCHINFFMRNREDIGTAAVASKNSPSFGRTVETIDSMLQSGRPVLVVSEADASEFPEGIELCQLPDTCVCEFKPMMNFIPFTLLMFHLGRMRGLDFFAGGMSSPLFAVKDMNKLKTSKVVYVD